MEFDYILLVVIYGCINSDIINGHNFGEDVHQKVNRKENLMGETTVTMATIISDSVQPVFTFLITSIGTIVQTIVGSPFLMLTTGIMVAFVAFKGLRAILRAY